MAMLSLCGLSDDSLFKSKCEVEENEAYETFKSNNTSNQMNLYTLPGNVSIFVSVNQKTCWNLNNIMYIKKMFNYLYYK